MRNLLLVVVMILLAVIEINGEYEFGDIISFERNCPCIRPLTYKHFAIYVGKTELESKDPIEDKDKDIFQRTGPVISKPLQLSDCIFGKLEEEKKPSKLGSKNIEKKDNYLDEILEFKPGTPEEIKQRITETKGKCGVYDPFANNCEHLAIYVRYGVKLSLQTDMAAEKYCKNTDKKICDRVEEIRKEIKLNAERKITCETKCTQSSSESIG